MKESQCEVLSKTALQTRVWLCVCLCLVKVRWEPEPEPNQHCSNMFVKHALTVFGLHWSLLDVNVVARQVQ